MRRPGGPVAQRLRFEGEIWGVGTASGTRVVIGRWPVSPFGSFADAMVERPGGVRCLIAPTAEVGEFIGALYDFDDVMVAPVTVERDATQLRFRGGPLTAALTAGRRHPLGWALRAVPRPVATNPAWSRAVDPLVRRTLRGVRTAGVTAGGREYYGATDRHDVARAEVTWDGEDLGPLAPVDPPVRFGFGSTPKRPAVVTVVTTVEPSGRINPP